MFPRARPDVGPLNGRSMSNSLGRHDNCAPQSSTKLRTSVSPNRTAGALGSSFGAGGTGVSSYALIADQRICDFEKNFMDQRGENDALHQHITELEARLAAYAQKEKKMKLLSADHRKLSEDMIIAREAIEK